MQREGQHRSARPTKFSPADWKETYAYTLGIQAHVFGFPLQCCRRDSERTVRFSGCTRIMPPRGLSISAIRRNAIDTANGSTQDTNLPEACVA